MHCKKTVKEGTDLRYNSLKKQKNKEGLALRARNVWQISALECPKMNTMEWMEK